MPWRVPASPDDFPSLGWQLLEWWAEYLPSPRDPASELTFTDEQAMQLVEWFRLDPVTGRLVYRRGFSRRSKGWGKSPVEAAKAIAEFRGPVRFGGWDAHGEPVGIPWGLKDAPRAWVQIGAISEDQTDNTWSVVHYFLTENDGKAADALRIDAGLTRCFLRDQPGAKLEPVSSAAGSREGQPITYGVIDESHLMVPSNGGVKLARTIRRNVAKMGGRSYETTNSPELGLDSVAESSMNAVLAGSPGIFSDEVEAPRVIDGIPVDLTAPDDVLLKALEIAYGDSWWVDKPRLVADSRDASTPWADSARFFFNWPQTGGGADSVIPSALWESCLSSSEEKPRLVVFAADATPERTSGTIATAGRRLDGSAVVEIVDQRPGVDWIAARLIELVEKYDTLTVVVDRGGPAGTALGALERDGVELSIPSASEVAQAAEGFFDAVTERAVVHQGDERLNRAVAGAKQRPIGQAWGWDRRGVSDDVSPLVAVSFALWGLLKSEADEPQVRF